MVIWKSFIRINYIYLAGNLDLKKYTTLLPKWFSLRKLKLCLELVLINANNIDINSKLCVWVICNVCFWLPAGPNDAGDSNTYRSPFGIFDKMLIAWKQLS